MSRTRTTQRHLLVLLLGAALLATACSSTDQGLAHGGAAVTGPHARPPLGSERPTESRLDPRLQQAVEAATRDARGDGFEVTITSGWRSRAHQARLFAEAVAKYGSEEEARRYVATPDTSAHVTGDAVDIGPAAADSWLSEHGADYGLCQIFTNEIWHFELATTPGGVCPTPYVDGLGR